MTELSNALFPGPRSSRRRLLRAGAITAGAATLVALPATGRATESSGREVVHDVAIDGRSFRVVRADQSDPSAPPRLGDAFVVYGTIFPAGTFDRGNLGPDQPGVIGRWICRGVFNVDVGTEAVPHVVSTVQHVLGAGLAATIGRVEQAADAIVHEGLEGGVPLTRRSILGGYGAFAGARGEAIQELRGENETPILLAAGTEAPAASYTFRFSILE